MKEMYAIGLMSGTSLDGLDICYVKFSKTESFSFEILATETIKYTKKWTQKLQSAVQISEEELTLLDIEFGRLLGNESRKFIEKHSLQKLDFIASHGHTVFHKPEKGITLQIGLGEEIARITGKKVVYDFRAQDVKMGGQGAPLVPIGDIFLFHNYQACLNLGGFSNISFDKNNHRIAFDISPVNIVLNKYAQKLGFPYDDKGNLAQKGTLIPTLFHALNKLDFYTLNPPKSLGIEWVNAEIFPILEGYKELDILRTFSEHIVFQILKTTEDNNIKDILISGGGTFNQFIINKLKENKNLIVNIPSKQIIEFKEALIFAFLGYLRIHNQDNILSSVTGASKNHSSGRITHNFA